MDKLNRIIRRIEETDMANQDRINELSDKLGTATEGLRADIQDLKDQVAAGTPAEELDFSALESRVDVLTALDAETPPASGTEV